MEKLCSVMCIISHLFVYHVKVKDDRIILDKTIADQVSTWKSRRGLTDKVVTDHACSGETCSYFKLGDVFVCEKTGNVHGRKFFFFFFLTLCKCSFI
jgi:hypothetical protein